MMDLNRSDPLGNDPIISSSPAAAPEARFAVLPNDKREGLGKLRQKFGRSHIVTGLANAEAG